MCIEIIVHWDVAHVSKSQIYSWNTVMPNSIPKHACKIWGKEFKNGPSGICGRDSLKI